MAKMSSTNSQAFFTHDCQTKLCFVGELIRKDAKTLLDLV